MRPYEIFDHTADIGLRIYGSGLPELFRHAGTGFFDLVTDASKIRDAGASREIEIEKSDTGELLLAWLRELLYYFSAHGLVFCRFDFAELSETRLKATVSGEAFDPRRHEQKCEVKAVTYHGFQLAIKNGLWRAEIIFDI